jgi:histidine triad (HIT) family protein
MDCIFCKIVDGKIPAHIIHKDEQAIAIEDINPQAPVHVLVIPKKHISTVLEIDDTDKELMGHLFDVANRVAKQKGIDKDGFRLVLNCKEGAGQTVFHVHLHLLGGRIMKWPPG